MKIEWQKQLYLWCKLKGHSDTTFIIYRGVLNKILTRFPDLQDATLPELQEYAASIPNDNTRKNTCVLIRWAFDAVLHKPIDWRDLPYPKKKRRIQPVYSQPDILKVLDAIFNAKQKAILGLMIDCGLRISEPCTIRIADCNSKQAKIILRGAKGNNDRIIYPSEFAWSLIKDYWKSLPVKPEKYLFEGQHKNTPYTPESIREFVKEHCRKAGVQYLGIHAIRRFTGTWKVENGVPETVVADLLGHKSVKTLHNHYLIHSPSYLQKTKTPLCRT